MIEILSITVNINVIGIHSSKSFSRRIMIRTFEKVVSYKD